MIDLSIIILNYKTSGLVKQALKNIEYRPITTRYEVIVVDNASNDGCIEMVKNFFPTVKTIQLNKNIGFGGGNNIAIKRAQGRFIVIVNPDVAILPEMIELLYTFINSRDDIGIVGPRLLNPDGSIQLSCFRFPTLFMPLYSRTFLKRFSWVKKKLDHYRMVDFNHNETRAVHWLVGGCLVLRKKALEEVGGFDERYFMYYEDIDLCRTFWEHNIKVYYYPEAEMVHYHQRLSADEGFLKSFINKTLYYHISSWRKYVLKYLRKPLPIIEEKIDIGA